MQKSHYLGFPSEGEMSLSPKELIWWILAQMGTWEVTTTWLGPHGLPKAEGMKPRLYDRMIFYLGLYLLL